MENKALLDYSKLSEGGEVVKPSSLAVSEFHFLLLIGNKVKVSLMMVTLSISKLVFNFSFVGCFTSTDRSLIECKNWDLLLVAVFPVFNVKKD